MNPRLVEELTEILRQDASNGAAPMFQREQLRSIHHALIVGLTSLAEIERVREEGQARQELWFQMAEHNMAPVHPTDQHEVGNLCEALRYVHHQIFPEEQRS